MPTLDDILFKAKNENLVIGIGAGIDAGKVMSSILTAEQRGYGRPRAFESAEGLVEALKDGDIDAAVRGSMGSTPVLKSLKEVFGVERVLRIALLETGRGHLFFLAPVGIDEGWTVDQKVEFITLGQHILERLDFPIKFSVLSGGRLSDRGRHSTVDGTISAAEEVVELCTKKGMHVDHSEILIEDAVQDHSFILAPDGISGNLIFRTLHFLGGTRAFGAPVINIERVFVDTSRAKTDYVDSIALASALASHKEQKI